MGHIASHCTERDITKCNKCAMVGHKESRCLKIWSGNYSSSTLKKLARCMECSKSGHFKCTSEKKSKRI